MNNDEKLAMRAVRIQFMYASRRNCHVGEKFFDKLCQNIKAMHLHEQIENILLAFTIGGFRKDPKMRENLYGKALDCLDYIEDSFN